MQFLKKKIYYYIKLFLTIDYYLLWVIDMMKFLTTKIDIKNDNDSVKNFLLILI